MSARAPTFPDLCAMDRATADTLQAAALRYRARVRASGTDTPTQCALFAAGHTLGAARERMDAPGVWTCAPLLFALSSALARSV